MLEAITVIGSVLLSWPVVGLLALILFRRALLEILHQFSGKELRRARVGPIELERATSSAQESEATRTLRSYLAVKVENLPEVWMHAHAQGLFRDPDTLSEMLRWYRAATKPDVAVAVRDENLRKANLQYASEIAILEGGVPTRVANLAEHRIKVSEIARRQGRE